jgi:hypothetical protein
VEPTGIEPVTSCLQDAARAPSSRKKRLDERVRRDLRNKRSWKPKSHLVGGAVRSPMGHLACRATLAVG